MERPQGAPLLFVAMGGVKIVDIKSKLLCLASAGLVLAWLMPNHYPPWAAFHAEAMAALALVPLALWSGFQVRRLDALAVCALLLSLVPLIQLVAGQIHFAGDAWMACLYLLGFGLTVQCGASLVNRDSDGERALDVIAPMQVAILLAAMISTGMAARQWLDLGFVSVFVIEKSADSRPYANLAQPNQLASLLMLGLAAVAFLYEARQVRAPFALAAAFFVTAGLAMTQSRTALLGFGLVWLAYFGLRRKSGLRTTVSALMAITVFYAVLAWIWPSMDAALLLKHAPSLTERIYANQRTVLWQSMIDAVALHPWAGWGWGQVTAAQKATALSVPPTYWWLESAHNLILDIAVWAGIPLSMFVTGVLFIWFAERIRGCRDPLAWCLLVGIGCMFCHAMVEYPLYYAYFLLPAGLLMGALSRQTSVKRSSSAPTSHRAIRLGLVALSLIAVSAYAKIVSEYFVLEQEWRDLRLSRALVGAEAPPPAPNIALLTQLQARANFSRIDPMAPMTPEQLAWMGRVSQRYGAATFMFPYAKALAANGQLAEAERQLEIMCRTQNPAACRRARWEWSTFGFPAAASSARVDASERAEP